MNRRELVRLDVLLWMADDYVEPAYIHKCVAEDLAVCGVAAVSDDEIRRSIIDLVESGIAKAYWLWGPGHKAEPIEGVPAADRFEKSYFLITEEGLRSLAVWRARDDWPWDDEGEPIPGWLGVSE